MSFYANDHGWLKVNSQPMRHYWRSNGPGDLYHSLCGRLAAPYKTEIAPHVDKCGVCVHLEGTVIDAIQRSVSVSD